MMNDDVWAVVGGDNLIVNTIYWNGDENSWSPPDGCHAESCGDINCQIGDYVDDGKFYLKPRDGWDYSFDKDNLEWVMTDDSLKEKAQMEADYHLNTAQSEYERASSKITAIQQQVDDEDYSDGETEESLTAEKLTWTSYRVKLRAYIKAADGSKELPVAPDA